MTTGVAAVRRSRLRRGARPLTDGRATRFAPPLITGSIKGVAVDNVSMPGGDELEEEARRRRQEQAGDTGDAGTEAAAENTGWCDGCDVPSCDSCDLPDCDCGGCDPRLRRPCAERVVGAAISAHDPRASGPR